MPDRALGIPRAGELELYELDLPPVGDGQLRVETLHTGLSTGTELSYLKGANPYLHAQWDAELGIFRRDGGSPPGYPVRRLGYMEVGRVAVSRSPAFAEGELVAMAYGHATAHVADPLTERVVPLPPDLDPLLGIYVAHMGPICANGLLHAAAELGPVPADLGAGVRGRLVLVTGAGVVGLIVGLWARALGAAEVAVADASADRLAVAAGLGLTPVEDPEPWRVLKPRWRHGAGDRGADVAFQCRGQVEPLAEALRCLRPQGTVIDLAFYPAGSEALRLGEEFHHNGLTIRCAQIGRVPRGLAHAWDRERLSRETIALLRAHGDAIREHVITDVVALEEAPALMQALASRQRQALQVVFSV